MTESLYVRAIAPNDVGLGAFFSRNWAENYSPWYIGHTVEAEVSDEKLDEMFEAWVDDADFDMWDTGDPMCEFEDFTDWLEERGYKCFYTGGQSIWRPRNEQEVNNG